MDLDEILKSRPIIILIYKYTVYVIYPVSWCLSNREDQILLTHYFEHLIKRPEQYLQSGLYLMTLMGSIIHGY